MKVVINTCFGGFGLSPKATEALARRKGHERLYWFKLKYGSGPGGASYTPVDVNDLHGTFFVSAYTTPDHQEGTSFYPDREVQRNDPDLVAVVEELGPEADGDYAELAVVEIPDEVEWYIEEYDGREHVAEKHRTWA